MLANVNTSNGDRRQVRVTDASTLDASDYNAFCAYLEHLCGIVLGKNKQYLVTSRLAPLLEKYLQGKASVSVEHRARILRLIENMTLGRNAVGYLTESLHGAGSPQAQRIQITRGMKIEEKKDFAKRIAGIQIE